MTNRRFFNFEANSWNRRGTRRRRRADSYGDNDYRNQNLSQHRNRNIILNNYLDYRNNQNLTNEQRLRRRAEIHLRNNTRRVRQIQNWWRTQRQRQIDQRLRYFTPHGGTRLRRRLPPTNGITPNLDIDGEPDIIVNQNRIAEDYTNPPPAYNDDIQHLPTYSEAVANEPTNTYGGYDRTLRAYGGQTRVNAIMLRDALNRLNGGDDGIFGIDEIYNDNDYADMLNNYNNRRIERRNELFNNRREGRRDALRVATRSIRDRWDRHQRRRIRGTAGNYIPDWFGMGLEENDRINLWNDYNNFAISRLTRENQSKRIQRWWRNLRERINNINRNLEIRENVNEEQFPDNTEEVEAIRNGELPVDEDGYVHFGENGNQPEEEPLNLNLNLNLDDVNLDEDRIINQNNIAPPLYAGGEDVQLQNDQIDPNRRVIIPPENEDENGDEIPRGEEEAFIVGFHRMYDDDDVRERQRIADIVEFNRRYNGPKGILINDKVIPFDVYKYKGRNYKARNRYVLYFDKENSTVGIKFVEYTPPNQGEDRRLPFIPDFNKRKIFYLHVFDNTNDIFFQGWKINIFNFNNASLGKFNYTHNDYNYKNDKNVLINTGLAHYDQLPEEYLNV